MKLLVNVNDAPGALEWNGESQLRYVPEGKEAFDASVSLIEVEPGVYSIVANGRSYQARVVKAGDGFEVAIGGYRIPVTIEDPRAFARRSRDGAGEGRVSIAAPMPGKVIRVLVREGDTVEAGAGLLVVEAMKMQNEMKAPRAGRIVQVQGTEGATVTAGEILAILE